MALDDSALLEMIEMLRTADGGELMRRLLGGMLQAVVDAEAAGHIGAGVHERSDTRTTQQLVTPTWPPRAPRRAIGALSWGLSAAVKNFWRSLDRSGVDDDA